MERATNHLTRTESVLCALMLIVALSGLIAYAATYNACP